MNKKLRQRLARRKHRISHRLDKANFSFQSPMIKPPAIQYELAERSQAIAAGGIGLIQQLVKQLDLPQTIARMCPILRRYQPYSEADHVLNIAYNLLAGGTCLEHLELRRNDEGYLNALGAQRIPDPTTAGDFCRRFGAWEVFMLMEAFNETRVQVWKQQPQEFFEEAIIEADGTMVETQGERKQGIGMNYKKQWGYHPLVMTLANTRELLYLVNRSGNRPSHERAPVYFDRAIDLCRRGGFKSVKLRGDTDFSQTAHLDRWHEDDVKFVFGIDAMPNLKQIAGDLPKSAWSTLRRSSSAGTGGTRRRRPNYREQIVIEKAYQNKQLQTESVAEFTYQPEKCKRAYRVVVVRKEIKVTAGQQWLFDDTVYHFYITNVTQGPPAAIVAEANDRCDQENIHSQLNALGALAAPLDTLNSNWAYMVIASLAWNLKCWLGLTVAETGKPAARQQRRVEKQRLIRMDFVTFRQVMIYLPTQIVRSSRRLIYRLLSWNPYVEVFFRLHEQLSSPRLC